MIITAKQKKKIEEIGEKHNLKLILLYGSYVNGKNQKESDLDVAVLGNNPVTFEQLLSIHSDMAEVFGNNRERELDINTLHRIDLLFRYQIAQNSQLLYGDLTDYNNFRAYAFSSYFDSRDLLNLEKTLVEKFQLHLNQKYA